jgi:hypothetical protein
VQCHKQIREGVARYSTTSYVGRLKLYSPVLSCPVLYCRIECKVISFFYRLVKDSSLGQPADPIDSEGIEGGLYGGLKTEPTILCTWAAPQDLNDI